MNEKLFRKIPLDKKEYVLLNGLAKILPNDYENSITKDNYKKIIKEYSEYKNSFPNRVFIERLDSEYLKHMTPDNQNVYFNTSIYDLNNKKPVFISYDHEKNEKFYDHFSTFKNWKDIFDFALTNINEVIKYAESFSIDYELNSFLQKSKYFSKYEGKINFKGSVTDLAKILYVTYIKDSKIIKEKEVKKGKKEKKGIPPKEINLYLEGIEFYNNKEILNRSVYKICNQILEGEVSKETNDMKEKKSEYLEIYNILNKTSKNS